MPFKDKKYNTLASTVAGVFLFLGSFKRQKPDISKDMASDLATGHSRLNVRANEKLRSKFRSRWLRPYQKG